MFYEDLSPYRYSAAPTGLPGVLNVGWLSRSMPFSRGAVVNEVANKIIALAAQPVLLKRGVHQCEFCHAQYGNGELWVGTKAGPIYAAPSMIAHYVEAHEYRPPAAFLEAISCADSALGNDECIERIRQHYNKLNACPEPGDILVPYYYVKIYWQRELFESLDTFENFVADRFPHEFNSLAVDKAGYHVLTESYSPRERLNDLANALSDSRLAPFKCTFTLVYLEGPEEEYVRGGEPEGSDR